MSVKLALAAALSLLPGRLFALSVTYSTSAVFQCADVAGSLSGCGTSTLVFGNTAVAGEFATLTFSGVGDTTVAFEVPGSAGGSFGSFLVTCGGCSSTISLPPGVALALMVHQSLPGSGDGGFSWATVQGAFSANSGSGAVTWPLDPSTAIVTGADAWNGGVVFYRILNPPVGLNGPGVNGGVTVLQGMILDVPLAMPEPGTGLLAGWGILGMAVWLCRQRCQGIRSCCKRANSWRIPGSPLTSASGASWDKI